jgi:hypothetical protein
MSPYEERIIFDRFFRSCWDLYLLGEGCAVAQLKFLLMFLCKSFVVLKTVKAKCSIPDSHI